MLQETTPGRRETLAAPRAEELTEAGLADSRRMKRRLGFEPLETRELLAEPCHLFL
jgi:hypothetical protein